MGFSHHVRKHPYPPFHHSPSSASTQSSWTEASSLSSWRKSSMTCRWLKIRHFRHRILELLGIFTGDFPSKILNQVDIQNCKISQNNWHKCALTTGFLPLKIDSSYPNFRNRHQLLKKFCLPLVNAWSEFSMLLAVFRNPFDKHPLHVTKFHPVNNGWYLPYQLVKARFLNHQQYLVVS